MAMTKPRRGRSKAAPTFLLAPAFSKKVGSSDGHNLQIGKNGQRSLQKIGYSMLGLRRHASY